MGMRIRAVSQDRETARLFSIAPGPVFRNTFFIASATGAVGGIFLASYAGVVRFDFGVQAGLVGFFAAGGGGLGGGSGGDTAEIQSPFNLVCRLFLVKKKKQKWYH